MNVLRQELKFVRTSTVLWAFVLVGLATMYIAIYPSFAKDATAMREVFAHVPAAARATLSLDVDSLLSFLGFFAITFTNLSLFASIYAMHTGLAIFSREARSKTTDFLLTKPRRRSQLFTEKLMTGLIAVVGVWMVLVIAAWVLAKVFGAGSFSTARYMLMMLGLLITQLWFFAAGVATSQYMKRVKSTIAPTLAVVFGFFMVGVVAAIVGIDALRYLSPFRYINYSQIATGHGYDMPFIVVAILSAAVLLGLSWQRYMKRDERAV